MKRKLVLLQLVVAIIMVCTSVYAAFDTTIDVTVSSSTVYQGDEVGVTLVLKDVDSSKKIINIEGYINYNKDILEKITYDSIVKDNDNKVKIGDQTLPVEDATNGDVPSSSSYVLFNGAPAGQGAGNDAKILIDCTKGITTDTDLITIKFKLKSDATIGDVENAIQFKDFTVRGEGDDDKNEDISKNIKITVKAKSNNNQNNNNKDDEKNEAKQEDNKNDTVGAANDKNQNKNTNNNTNKNTNKNNTNVNTNNTNTDNSVAGKKLPAAGAKVLVVPAIVLIAISYITYNRYIRMRGI